MADDEDFGETTEGYQVSKKVGLKEIMEQEAEDESLRKYKEALLGKSMDPEVSPPNDPRRVVIKKMEIIVEGREDNTIVMDLAADGAEKNLKQNPFTLKEGCKFKTRIEFKVQHEIVSGLKLVSVMKKKGIKVASGQEMLGSFPPQKDYHSVVFPRHGWQDAPSGMLARGNFVGKHRFVDDDRQCHLEYEFGMALKKNWAE